MIPKSRMIGSNWAQWFLFLNIQGVKVGPNNMIGVQCWAQIWLAIAGWAGHRHVLGPTTWAQIWLDTGNWVQILAFLGTQKTWTHNKDGNGSTESVKKQSYKSILAEFWRWTFSNNTLRHPPSIQYQYITKGPITIFGNEVNNLANDLYCDKPLIDTGPIRWWAL